MVLKNYFLFKIANDLVLKPLQFASQEKRLSLIHQPWKNKLIQIQYCKLAIMQTCVLQTCSVARICGHYMIMGFHPVPDLSSKIWISNQRICLTLRAIGNVCAKQSSVFWLKLLITLFAWGFCIQKGNFYIWKNSGNFIYFFRLNTCKTLN